MKNILRIFLLLFIFSCAKPVEEEAVSPNRSLPNITLGIHNNFTDLINFTIPIDDFSQVSLITVYDDSSCTSVGSAYDTSVFSSGLPVTLTPNSSTLVFVRLNNLSDCLPIGEYIHDDTPPASVAFAPALIGSTILSKSENVRFDIDGSQVSDLYKINIYGDPAGTTLLATIDSALLSQGLGTFSLPIDSVSAIYFRGSDRVGNLTSVYGPVNFDIDTTPPQITSVSDGDDTITANTSYTLTGVFSSDVQSIEVTQNSITLPLISKAQFESGEVFTLATDTLNVFQVVAVDAHGNRSAQTSKTIRHVTSPVYNYDLAVDSNVFEVNAGLDFDIELYVTNNSFETTSSTAVRTGLMDSISSVGMTVTNSSCTTLEVSSGCTFNVTGNISSTGAISINFDVDLSGVTITKTVNFNVNSLTTPTPLSNLLTTNSSTKIEGIDVTGELLLLDNGAVILDDDTFVGKSGATIQKIKSSKYSFEGKYFNVSSTNLEVTDFSSETTTNYPLGFSPSYSEFHNIGDVVIGRVTDGVTNKIISINLETNTQNSLNSYTDISNISKNSNSISFIGDGNLLIQTDSAITSTALVGTHNDKYIYSNSTEHNFTLEDGSGDTYPCVYSSSVTCGLTTVHSILGEEIFRQEYNGSTYAYILNSNDVTVLTTSTNEYFKGSFIGEAFVGQYTGSGTTTFVHYDTIDGTTTDSISNPTNAKAIYVQGKLYSSICVENANCITSNSLGFLTDVSAITDMTILNENSGSTIFKSGNFISAVGNYKSMYNYLDISDLKVGELPVLISRSDNEDLEIVYQKTDNSFVSYDLQLNNF